MTTINRPCCIDISHGNDVRTNAGTGTIAASSCNGFEF